MVKKTAKQTGHTILEDYKIVDSSKRGTQAGEASITGQEEKDEQKEEPEKEETKKEEK